jgi:hypothetical protein
MTIYDPSATGSGHAPTPLSAGFSRRSTSGSDRTVHAESDNAELVRYDRAGKWYVEYRDHGCRRCLTLAEAVDLSMGMRLRLGQPGGRRFDKMVMQAIYASAATNAAAKGIG